MRRIFFFLLLLYGITGYSIADSLPEDEKLEQLNSRIAEVQAQLDQLNRQKDTLLRDIYKIDLRYKKEQMVMSRIHHQLENSRREIEQLEEEKNELEMNISWSRENIRRMVRLLYKMGDNAYLKLFLKIEDFNQLFRNYPLMATIIRYKMEEIHDLRSKINRLDEVREKLLQSYRQVANLKEQQEGVLDEIAGIRRSKSRLMEDINKDDKKYNQVLAELQYEAQRLTQMLYQRQGKIPPQPINIDFIRGRLQWPVSGKVTSTFGKKRSTQFDTYTINDGIEIQPDNQKEVRAVYAGEVVFADYFMGYGNLLIVEHSRGFHTLYGHCATFLKTSGDRVMEGESIAIAGNTGSTQDTRLYFGVRKDLQAEDPLKWLRKSPTSGDGSDG